MRTWMIAIGVSVLFSALAGAETWICKQPDGTEVFTDSGSGPNCTRYFPKSELGQAAGGAMGQPDREGYSQPPTASEGRSPTEAGARQPGDITFEQFRMLSTGMTEGQVLAKIGPPASRITISCTATSEKLSPQDRTTTVTCPTLWTYIMGDGWTADLTFSANRLVDIQSTKTP